MKRVLIIGLDGITFDTFDPWMEEGILPNIARFRDAGVHASLDSIYPPITAPAWASFMTGMNPGKTGIFEFLYSRSSSFDFAPVNATVRDGIPIWDILSREGKEVVVISVPVTYPPDKVNGSLISGFLTPQGARDFTHPPELLDRIEKEFGPYPIYHKEVYQKGKVDRVIDEANRILRYRRDMTLKLLDEQDWDFAITYFEGTDRMQHEVWHIHDESHPHSTPGEVARYKDKVLGFYREVDETVRMLTEAVDDGETVVMIMSDHGFGPIHYYLNLNIWLLESGFLKLKRDPFTRLKQLIFKLGITPALGYRTAMKLGLAGLRLSKGVGGRNVIFDMINRIFLSLENIDWPRTRAYSKGNYGQIYVNLKGREPLGSVDPGDYDSVVNDLKEGLRLIPDPETGGRLMKEVFHREEMYTGPYVERMPDVFFKPANMLYKALGVVDFTTKHFIEPTFGNSGDHRMNGVFLARGGEMDVRRERLPEISIMDVVPTVLHALGLAVPDDMDGKVIEAAFRKEWLEKNPVRLREPYEREDKSSLEMSEEDKKELIDRLKGMGYVG